MLVFMQKPKHYEIAYVISLTMEMHSKRRSRIIRLCGLNLRS